MLSGSVGLDPLKVGHLQDAGRWQLERHRVPVRASRAGGAW